MDHALEISWWKTDLTTKVTQLPVTSRSFLRNTQDPNWLDIQIEETCAQMEVKWRPLLMILDICQLHALFLARTDDEDAIHATQLLIWYEKLRLHVVGGAKGVGKLSGWMPDVMHKFLIRLEQGKGHSPRVFQKSGEKLRLLYSQRSIWSYDLLSWLQNLEFDWLPELLQVVDPYSTGTMNEVNNFIENLKNDCVVFGLNGIVKVLEVEVLDPQPDSKVEPVKKKRGRPRKVPIVEVNTVESVRVLRKHVGETQGTAFLAALPALTPPSPQKPKKRKRYQAKKQLEEEAAFSAEDSSVDEQVAVSPKRPKIEKGQQPNHNQAKFIKKEVEDVPVKKDIQTKQGSSLLVSKINKEDSETWWGLLMQNLPEGEGQLFKHLETLSAAIAGIKKQDLLRDLIKANVDFNTICDLWEQKSKRSNYQATPLNDSLTNLKKAIKVIRKCKEADKLDSMMEYFEKQ